MVAVGDPSSHDQTARLIDWAWPTKGAAFIDPACLIVRLVFAGHTPAAAEALVATLPAWTTAPRHAIDVYANAVSQMWTEIAEADPTPWKQQTQAAAQAWQFHRRRSRALRDTQNRWPSPAPGSPSAG